MKGYPFRTDPYSNTKEELPDCQAASGEDPQGSLFILFTRITRAERAGTECQPFNGMSQGWPAKVFMLRPRPRLLTHQHLHVPDQVFFTFAEPAAVRGLHTRRPVDDLIV